MTSSKRMLKICALLAIIVAAILVRMRFSFFTADDALITFRYSANLAGGSGFVYNIGESVLGTTTPLFAWMISVFMKMGLDPVQVSKIIGLISSIVVLIVIYASLKAVKHECLGLGAALLFALDPYSSRWAVSGMETPFYTMLIVLSLYTYMTQRYKLCSLFSALSMLTRPDGMLLGAVLFTHYLFSRKRIWISFIAIHALILLPWAGFALTYFGNILPNTLGAKIVQGDNLGVLFDMKMLSFHLRYCALIPFFILGSFAALLKRKLLPLVIWYSAYIAAYFLLGMNSFSWYYIPPVPVFLMISALGISSINFSKNLSFISSRHLSKAAASIVFIIFIALLMAQIPARLEVTEEWQDDLHGVHKRTGLWLDENSEEDSTVMVSDIGYVGYFSDRYIYDLDTLISPQLREDVENGDFKGIIRKHEPDFVVLGLKSKHPYKHYWDSTWFFEKYVLEQEFIGKEYEFSIFRRCG